MSFSGQLLLSFRTCILNDGHLLATSFVQFDSALFHSRRGSRFHDFPLNFHGKRIASNFDTLIDHFSRIEIKLESLQSYNFYLIIQSKLNIILSFIYLFVRLEHVSRSKILGYWFSLENNCKTWWKMQRNLKWLCVSMAYRYAKEKLNSWKSSWWYASAIELVRNFHKARCIINLEYINLTYYDR